VITPNNIIKTTHPIPEKIAISKHIFIIFLAKLNISPIIKIQPDKKNIMPLITINAKRNESI